jgi:hypothetical protein
VKNIQAIFLTIICLCMMSPAMAEIPIKRTVVGIYDSKYDGSLRFSRVHSFLEMPLNHLGYKVAYQDVRAEFKPLSADTAGVVVWLDPGAIVNDPEQWLKWLNSVVDADKKLIFFGNLGFPEKYKDTVSGVAKINALLKKIGVEDTNQWFNLTYDAKITYADPLVTGFERQYRDLLKPFLGARALTANGAKSHLKILTPQYEDAVSDLVITHPKGAYIALDYEVYEHLDGHNEVVYHQWYVNPFELLRIVFDGTHTVPKADVTTLNGRKIFYSHIDGDGWNSLAELEEYKGKKVITAEVLYEKIFSKYTEYPFTVAPIAGELILDCYGVPGGEEVARKIYTLPNVEAGSHSYSHPLYWGFFAKENVAEREAVYLDKYAKKPYEQFFMSKWFIKDKQKSFDMKQKYISSGADPMRGISAPDLIEDNIIQEYKTPRSFACEPYNLGKEIGGSMRYVESLTEGKKVNIYQWSGDTRPHEAALAEVRLNGAYNINGGGSRYDVEYPSYTSISSIGVQVGDERQIYSSNTNENDYTDLWTDRFFGFRYLQTTVENTELPIRVHPFNIYFHSYSGQKQASLNALMENFRYATTQKLSPIFTSDYAAIANSFYKTEFVQITPQRWQVLNRGALQTVRFDRATLKAVDINNSKGILGQKYQNGSLYVALDSAVKTPVIQLSDRKGLGGYPRSLKPYLIESNWKINDLKFIKNKLTFTARGFGKPDMIWKQPSSGNYIVGVQSEKETIFEDIVEAKKDNLLHLVFPTSSLPINVTITPAVQKTL